jgi:phage baseplate assembly protein W
MFGKVNTKVVADHEATLQNLKYLLSSEQGELLGDPYFGVKLKRYLFDQNNYVLKDILIDEIYTQVATFMPQLRISRKDIEIEQDGTTLNCSIKAINLLDYTTDMYNIVLLTGEERI